MKTVAFVPELASKRPGSTGSPASALADTQPAYWRSEAFAEDLPDSATLTLARSAGPQSQPPLLRRALSRLLRR
jgi:hypothetical protein